MQSVYSPQVDHRTAVERIRWGKVYGNLEDLASAVANSTSPTPLLLPGDTDRCHLATALCKLFRTSFPAELKTKVGTPSQGTRIDVVQRISAIHRQIAALHKELADLVLAAAGVVKTGQPLQATPAPHAKAQKAPPLTDHQRMHAHMARSFQGVNGNADAAKKALETAWRSVLNDPLLRGESGISVSLFGAVGAPLVKEQHGSLPNLLGMPLRKWCLLQAEAGGMKPLDVPGKPSNIRVH